MKKKLQALSHIGEFMDKNHIFVLTFGIYWLVSILTSFGAFYYTAKKKHKDEYSEVSIGSVLGLSCIIGPFHFPIIVFGLIFKLFATLYYKVFTNEKV